MHPSINFPEPGRLVFSVVDPRMIGLLVQPGPGVAVIPAVFIQRRFSLDSGFDAEDDSPGNLSEQSISKADFAGVHGDLFPGQAVVGIHILPGRVRLNLAAGVPFVTARRRAGEQDMSVEKLIQSEPFVVVYNLTLLS